MKLVQCVVVDRSFLHGDRDFVISVKRRTAGNSRSSYRYTIQNKDRSSRSNRSEGRQSSSRSSESDLKESSSMEGITAAAMAGAAIGLDYTDDDDDDDSFDLELKKFKALVLDLSYRPVNVVGWKRALCLEILEKAEVLVYYDQIVCSPSRAFFIPAVLRMSGFVYAPKSKHVRMSLSRTNVFIRDKFRCQYCNGDRDLTIDHVHPISKGGGHSWDNLVTACKICNGKKGSRTLEDAQMKLEKPPKEPGLLESRDLPPSYRVFKSIVLNSKIPSEWVDYLPRRPNKQEYKRFL